MSSKVTDREIKAARDGRYMLDRSRLLGVLEGYDRGRIRIGALGSHSALEIMDGAKDEGFPTVVVCQEGRERAYRYFKRLVDEMILLPRFSDMVGEEVQRKLRALNTIFVPHRAFTTYISYHSIEEDFLVPLFGNRALLRVEERTEAKNQYYLLEKAGIRHPKLYEGPEAIDGPVLVKVPEARRRIERAFFVASSRDEYHRVAKERIERGIIREEDLKSATIEELVLGTYFNFNFFYSPLEDSLELLGIDRRLQTNWHDFVALPARLQLELPDLHLQNIEVGHMPATLRESLLERVFELGERFVRATKEEYPPGIIGPFALQCIITLDLEPVVYDVAPRVPGSPIITTTSPYAKYHHGGIMGTGRRIALEIKWALEQDRLEEVIT